MKRTIKTLMYMSFLSFIPATAALANTRHNASAYVSSHDEWDQQLEADLKRLEREYIEQNYASYSQDLINTETCQAMNKVNGVCDTLRRVLDRIVHAKILRAEICDSVLPENKELAKEWQALQKLKPEIENGSKDDKERAQFDERIKNYKSKLNANTQKLEEWSVIHSDVQRLTKNLDAPFQDGIRDLKEALTAYLDLRISERLQNGENHMKIGHVNVLPSQEDELKNCLELKASALELMFSALMNRISSWNEKCSSVDREHIQKEFIQFLNLTPYDANADEHCDNVIDYDSIFSQMRVVACLKSSK